MGQVRTHQICPWAGSLLGHSQIFVDSSEKKTFAYCQASLICLRINYSLLYLEHLNTKLFYADDVSLFKSIIWTVNGVKTKTDFH